jgi:murein DD-endopeptidase MepM/ murein hydrolase activator NlpD
MSRATPALLALVVAVSPVSPSWEWPSDEVRIVAPYAAPAHAYGPGHRGVDIAASGELRAPAEGVVAFSGTVVDRGVLTIDHGDGWVLTLEPVASTLPAGASVRPGDVVATASAGGHAAAGSVHLGVRKDGEYVNPLLLFGGVPRAVLLPCC